MADPFTICLTCGAEPVKGLPHTDGCSQSTYYDNRTIELIQRALDRHDSDRDKELAEFIRNSNASPDFVEGVFALRNRLLNIARHHFHASPVLNKQCERDNALVTMWLEDALSSISISFLPFITAKKEPDVS